MKDILLKKDWVQIREAAAGMGVDVLGLLHLIADSKLNLYAYTAPYFIELAIINNLDELRRAKTMNESILKYSKPVQSESYFAIEPSVARKLTLEEDAELIGYLGAHYPKKWDKEFQMELDDKSKPGTLRFWPYFHQFQQTVAGSFIFPSEAIHISQTFLKVTEIAHLVDGNKSQSSENQQSQNSPGGKAQESYNETIEALAHYLLSQIITAHKNGAIVGKQGCFDLINLLTEKSKLNKTSLAEQIHANAAKYFPEDPWVPNPTARKGFSIPAIKTRIQDLLHKYPLDNEK